MNVLFLDQLISDKIIQAICWTFFHSLWQGALLAIIAAIMVTTTRRSKPSIRYNLLTVLLIIFVAAAAFTFIRELSILENSRVATTPLPTESLTIISGNPGTQNDQLSTALQVGYFDRITQFLNRYASMVVAAWFIFFSIKLARMIFNIRYVQRIRYSQTFEPPGYWKRRIVELAQTLGIDRLILLRESSIIKSPMVIGLLKPVILIPLGLLANLPTEQVEAVLLHELAHIRRNDYLANLLQTFSEVIFFFNPAVIWISSLLREERENCCDDISIDLTKNKKQFIYALVAFQEFILQQSNSAIGVAFAGERKYLLNRVKRIIYNENKKLNAMGKGMFILSIVIISVVGLAAIKHVPSQSAKKFGNSTFINAALDTVPPKKEIQQVGPDDVQTEFKNITSVTNMEGSRKITTILATDKNGKIYKLTIKDEALMELYVNNKKISQEEFGNYKETIAAIEREAEIRQKENMAKMKMDQAEQEKKLMQLNAERNELMQKLSAIDEQRAKLDYDKSGIDELPVKLYGDKRQLQNQEWNDAATQELLKSLQGKAANGQNSLFDLEGALKFKWDSAEQQMNLANKEHLEDLLQNHNAMNQKYDLLLNQMNLFNNNALEGLQQQTNILIDPVIEQMIEENMIAPGQDEISFELNSKSFILNGKKQSAEVHQRFKNKFLKGNSDYIKFSRKGAHTSTSINLN